MISAPCLSLIYLLLTERSTTPMITAWIALAGVSLGSSVHAARQVLVSTICGHTQEAQHSFEKPVPVAGFFMARAF